MNKEKGLPALYEALDWAMGELDTTWARVAARLQEYGIDLYSYRYDPKPGRRTKKRAPLMKKVPQKRGRTSTKRQKASSELSSLKLQHRSVNALQKAGYRTLKDLNGASRARLGKIKWLGAPAIQKIAKALEKQGMGLVD